MTSELSHKFDLDRYYTPAGLAERIFSEHITLEPKSCADTTCGTGNLLKAAANIFDSIKCIGLDRDKNVIQKLRRHNPNWILSVANLLNPESCKRTRALSTYEGCDLLLLNPPFSQGRTKSVITKYNGEHVRSSVAMAYILRSFDIFRPEHGAVVFAPESILYSDIDNQARRIFYSNYRFDELAELENTTFRGARVHAIVLKISPGQHFAQDYAFPKPYSLQTKLIRGGLPVHEMHEERNGVPFIHTTDIRQFSRHGSLYDFRRTGLLRRGRLSGWVILLPRVGIPHRESVTSLFLYEEAQLSDCVIALTFKTKNEIIHAESIIKYSWKSFVNLYRGTGARYITLARLSKWLLSVGISNTYSER